MAIPVARVHLAVAHAALPALLPTPPKWKMVPPPPPCVLVTRPVPAPKPCRADAVERWDANKAVKPLASPTSSSGSSGRRTPDGPGRASACERWDSNKTSASSSSSSRSASRASSSGEKWGSSSSKRSPAGTGSRASSSAERWDAHKKPRPPHVGVIEDDGQSSSSDGMELDLDELSLQRAFYAGPGFLAASPEPSMLPIPSSLMVRAAA